MFDTDVPSQRRYYRPRSPQALLNPDTTVVLWDFADGRKPADLAPGVAPAIVKALRAHGAGRITLYAMADAASVLIGDYNEFSKLQGVSLILLSPREKRMPPPPWPVLDPQVAFLLSNENTDPSLESDAFKHWIAANKHPVTSALKHQLSQWAPEFRVPLARMPGNGLAAVPEAPDDSRDFAERLRPYSLRKVSDYVLGRMKIWELLPAEKQPFSVLSGAGTERGTTVE
jgi:hypothetical protein